MNFTSNDMAIIVAMTVAVIGLSFTMPALGLGGSQASDPPEFNMSADRFDFAGEFPENPGTPSSGTLRWNETADYPDNQVWIEKDRASLTALTDTEPQVNFILFNDTAVEAEQSVFRNTSGTEVIELQDWQIRIDFYDIEEVNATAGEYNFAVDYTVEERPSSDGGFISSIPVVGGIFDAGSQLASIVGWGVSVVWWVATTTAQTAINVIGMAYDIAAFGAGLMGWMGSTYAAVIAGSSSWATIFLAIPSVILSLEFAKIIMILISLLPTT